MSDELLESYAKYHEEYLEFRRLHSGILAEMDAILERVTNAEKQLKANARQTGGMNGHGYQVQVQFPKKTNYDAKLIIEAAQKTMPDGKDVFSESIVSYQVDAKQLDRASQLGWIRPDVVDAARKTTPLTPRVTIKKLGD